MANMSDTGASGPTRRSWQRLSLGHGRPVPHGVNDMSSGAVPHTDDALPMRSRPAPTVPAHPAADAPPRGSLGPNAAAIDSHTAAGTASQTEAPPDSEILRQARDELDRLKRDQLEELVMVLLDAMPKSYQWSVVSSIRRERQHQPPACQPRRQIP